MRVIYIAGPISGKKDPWFLFDSAAFALRAKGWIVLNPVELPKGMTEAAYMDICLAMVRNSNAILLLDGWEDSVGATCERALAMKLNHERYYHLNEVPAVTRA